MRFLVFLFAIAVVILNGCSTKTSDESASGMDSLAAGEKAPFLLDSLLYFDRAGLVAAFGAENVKDSVGYHEMSGEEEPYSVIFSGTNKAVAFKWQDDSRTGLSEVIIKGQKPGGNIWQTKNGLRIGMSVADVEQLNGKPFTFFTVSNASPGDVYEWNGGTMLGMRKATFDVSNLRDQLEGVPISSAGDAAKRVNPMLVEIAIDSYGRKNTIEIEAVKFGDSAIPRAVNHVWKNDPAVNVINKTILERFMIGSFDPKTEKDFSWQDVTFKHEKSASILMVSYSGTYMAAYPNDVTETMLFSMYSGEIVEQRDVPWHNLFTMNGFLYFWKTSWQPGCEQRRQEAKECAGDMDPYCKCEDIELSQDGRNLVLTLQQDCFPHAAQSCAPAYSMKMDEAFQKLHLSDFGKKMMASGYLKLSALQRMEKYYEIFGSTTEAPKLCFIHGSIDGKYPITMALEFKENPQKDRDGDVKGSYFYDKVGKPIQLTGKYSGDGVSLYEEANGVVTGTFTFGFEDEQDDCRAEVAARYLGATWTNTKTDQTLPLCFDYVRFTSDVYYERGD